MGGRQRGRFLQSQRGPTVEPPGSCHSGRAANREAPRALQIRSRRERCRPCLATPHRGCATWSATATPRSLPRSRCRLYPVLPRLSRRGRGPAMPPEAPATRGGDRASERRRGSATIRRRRHPTPRPHRAASPDPGRAEPGPEQARSPVRGHGARHRPVDASPPGPAKAAESHSWKRFLAAIAASAGAARGASRPRHQRQRQSEPHAGAWRRQAPRPWRG